MMWNSVAAAVANLSYLVDSRWVFWSSPFLVDNFIELDVPLWLIRLEGF